MKLPMKINFGIIKNKKVKIGYVKENSFYGYEGILKKVIQKGERITFIFEDDKKMEIDNSAFLYSNIRMKDNTVVICYDENKPVFSGFVGFTMFDTYGFPVEMLQEIMSEMTDIHYDLDLEGYNILRTLQKGISYNEQFSGAFAERS